MTASDRLEQVAQDILHSDQRVYIIVRGKSWKSCGIDMSCSEMCRLAGARPRRRARGMLESPETNEAKPESERCCLLAAALASVLAIGQNSPGRANTSERTEL